MRGRNRRGFAERTSVWIAYSQLGARTGDKTASYLAEAGAFEWEARREPAAAERHLSLALRLSPHDPVLLARYREVSAEVIEAQRRGRSRRDG